MASDHSPPPPNGTFFHPFFSFGNEPYIYGFSTFMRLEIFIQGKRSLKYVAAKRKQISISGGGDIWRGPGTANSKLTASCHQRPGPNSLPAFYFYSSSSTDFNACALRTLLSIGLALDFHRAPRQNVSVQSFLPPATSVIVSRVVICFKRGNI